MLNPVTELEGSDFNGMFFEGTVVKNDDPDHEERCRIRIKGLHDDIADKDIPWARPACKSIQASLFVNFGAPPLGAQLYVGLQGGDIMFPLYFGAVVNKTTKATEADTNYPNRYGHKDKKGNIFFIDTQTGDVDFHHFTGTFIKILPSGEINAHSASNVTLDVVGNILATVGGNTTLTTTGKNTITSTGDTILNAAKVTATITSDLTATVAGNTSITTTGTTLLKSTGKTTVKGTNIDIDGGGTLSPCLNELTPCPVMGITHTGGSTTVKVA